MNMKHKIKMAENYYLTLTQKMAAILLCNNREVRRGGFCFIT